MIPPPSSTLSTKGEENESKYSESSCESAISPNRSSEDSKQQPQTSKHQSSLLNDDKSENQPKLSEKNPPIENTKIHPFPLIRSDPVVASSKLESYLLNSQSREITEISRNSDNENEELKRRINVKEEFQREQSNQGETNFLRL